MTIAGINTENHALVGTTFADQAYNSLVYNFSTNTITNLESLPQISGGTYSNLVPLAIDNQGQILLVAAAAGTTALDVLLLTPDGEPVVATLEPGTGVSYTGSDGAWTATGVLGQLGISYDAGAQSFLYTNGQMTTINPTDGPAIAINDAGQVVGGHFTSINNSGQYVGSSGSGLVYENQFSMPAQIVSGGVTANAPIVAYAINNSGEMVGSGGSNLGTAAFSYQNGQATNLSSEFNLNGKADWAYAISSSGYILIAEGLMAGSSPIHYVLVDPTGYHFSGVTGASVTDLTDLAGGSGKIATAVNDLGHVVGNGFLYSVGQFTSLQSLLPAVSSGQWSNLVATGINDSGQIVGQGTYDGQQVALLMTPDGVETPEPASFVIFAVGAAILGLRGAARRVKRRSA
jgi:hypothetical protein